MMMMLMMMMNPVVLQFHFILVSSFIWVFNFDLSHASRDSPQLSPFPIQFHPMYPPPASLPPAPPVMQIVVQEKNVHLGKELLLAIIFASAAVALIILAAFCACFIWRRRNGLKSGPANVQISDTTGTLALRPVLNRFNPLSIRGSIPEVEYTLIEAATNNFSEGDILEKEGHGMWYKAHFNFGSVAAVKKLECKEPCCERAFENEIVLLSNIKHPNIISILGYCVGWEVRLLVYELMQNGSLETKLRGSSSGSRLSWHIRMKIALDAARGLEYLHEHCNPPVVHRALKSSNILLDSNFNAKISDFGLACAGGNHNDRRIKLSDIKGHVAPEYLLSGELTEKSDVYAFGLVLLELLMGRNMGRKAIERMPGPRGQSGITWAMPQLIDREKLPGIVDPVIRHTMDQKHLCQVAAIAVLCIQQEPSYRPLITDVVHSLIPLVPIELGGTSTVSGSRS